MTLEAEGVAMFPDAPTERGIKHVRALEAAREEGVNVLALDCDVAPAAFGPRNLWRCACEAVFGHFV